MWIQIFIALLAYLSSKKKGADSTQAALLGVAAGVGAHYVVKNTEFGQKSLQPINDSISGWFGIGEGTIEDGTVKDANGNTVTGPANTAPIRQADGSVVWVPAKQESTGSSWFGSISDVLKDWGAQGTALVIGTSAAAGSKNFMPLLLIGGVVLLLVAT